jgi:CHASE2 domain-containing sensor protein
MLHSINVLTFVKFGDTPKGYLKWFVYIFELLLVLGFFFNIYRLYEKFKTKQIFKLDCLMLIASTVIIVIIANLSWIPLSWDRLLIPFLAPIAIVVGFTIESIIWMFSKLLD